MLYKVGTEFIIPDLGKILYIYFTRKSLSELQIRLSSFVISANV